MVCFDFRPFSGVNTFQATAQQYLQDCRLPQHCCAGGQKRRAGLPLTAVFYDLPLARQIMFFVSALP
ncbi:MAG: hypothetical protein ACO3Z6_13035, partial [Pseudomonadales bacterium]